MGGAQFAAIEDNLRKLPEQFGPSSAAAQEQAPSLALRAGEGSTKSPPSL